MDRAQESFTRLHPNWDKGGWAMTADDAPAFWNRHGFRCDSAVGRVFNTLVPGGFDHGISEHGIPAPRVAMPPPGVSALSVWRELDPQRPRPPWDGSTDPQWQIRVADGRPPSP